MKVVVTGGAGFIGGHLCEYLAKQGHEVVVIDNRYPYYDNGRKERRLDNLSRYANVQLNKVDLLDREGIKTIFQDGPYDALVHLAAVPGVPYSFEQPEEYIKNNITGTLHVLELAGEAQIPHVIFGSSSSVYGDQEGPLKEIDAVGQVVSPYAASKVSGEAYAHMYQHRYGFQLSILRFFTVYGPEGRPDMAIQKFIERAQAGLPIDVYGKGTSRDYTYIDDIIMGIYQTLLYAKGNEVYNLGSNSPVTLEELINELKLHYPAIEINEKPYRMGDVKHTWADIDKAREQLGFTPAYSFREGLKRTIDWLNRTR
ncbi:UDP-glucose 4-epimerase [Pontibacillus halophilus JSM 076056 = DSM 19796]|uniref:UDP-glucose 4-epimerase n=1 Tax=Pontibacillus halophilus JSM 076056 = DSM 19796 TaxID=1385510 RepID=A0A0A5IC65_9BACI|nr:NAD-dependent epimerase/dehydratase family protein [Pontibacillus halophilus]KGX93432.1 UDP-glucose 4-epimerase [Pontibacillus halophilus JSM 076056 = DSM 19796]